MNPTFSDLISRKLWVLYLACATSFFGLGLASSLPWYFAIAAALIPTSLLIGLAFAPTLSRRSSVTILLSIFIGILCTLLTLQLGEPFR
jgi:uncharacterized membrane protein YoaK (UPF0700 family)